ncbi:MAG TPA: PAS domain-containing sensor histidine kinase [Nocardioidaceae bacterium]|nr:PAS domain-containing sensor histidine kinase [Nocardioidaceae bacterium]
MVGATTTRMQAESGPTLTPDAGPASALWSAHLEAAVEAVADGVLLVDPAGQVLAWNTSAARLLAAGLSLTAACELAPAFQDPAAFRRLLERCFQGEQLREHRLVVDGLDGRGGPVGVRLVPGRTGGVVSGCTVVLHDLSEQLLAQQALADGERRVRLAEDLANIGTFVLDAQDGAEQWSEGMYRLMGVDPAETLPSRQVHLDLVASEHRALLEELFEQGLAGETPPGIDHRVHREGRTDRWLFTVVEPQLDAEGRVLGLRGVCQDVNDRVSSEAALQRELEREQAVSDELRHLDALKDELVATASHELRTPLTSIAGFASLLHGAAPEYADLVEPIERKAREMHRLIQLLLDRARLSSDLVVDATTFELVPAIQEVLEEQSDQLGETTVVVAVPDSATIHMDREAFALVLGNLVGNAAKYAGGGILTISSRTTDDGVAVTVADDGVGIAQEFVDHVFEPFFRVPETSRKAIGSGFGLAIVRRYVELHGGSVHCESTLGEGAAFTFTVPPQKTTTAS